MSPIELYAHPQSPPCRNVTLVLDVLGIDYEYKYMDLFAGAGRKPDYIKKNIQHNVPFLVDGDFSLNESHAIMVYLAEKYGGSKSYLFPTAAEDLKTRTKINQRLCFSIQVFWDSFAQAFRPLVFQGSKEIDPAKVDRLKEVFGFMQHFLKTTGFIAETKEVSLADLACLATYSTIEMTKEVFVNVNDFPDVVAWADRVKNLIPNYEEANGKGAKVFEDFFRTKTGMI